MCKRIVCCRFYNSPTVICVQGCVKQLHAHTSPLLGDFLQAFAKLRKDTRTFVRLSVRMEEVGYHWTDFRKNRHFRIFQYYLQEIQVSLKYENNNGYFI